MATESYLWDREKALGELIEAIAIEKRSNGELIQGELRDDYTVKPGGLNPRNVITWQRIKRLADILSSRLESEGIGKVTY